MQYVYKGKHNPAINYVKKDVVSYQPASGEPIKYYFCLTDHINQLPNATVDNAYWAIINELSNFPNNVDTFMSHSTIQASDKTTINRYQTLMLQTTLSPAEQDELNTLTQTLRNKLIMPEDFNALQQSISNMQMYMKDSIEGYIQTKQTEFDAELNKFTHKGEYNPTVQYRKRNTITFNGETYLCLQDTLGIVPDATQNTSQWAKIAARGAKGDQGIAGTGLRFKGSWNATVQYRKDDAVQYGGQIYACLADSIGNEPNPNQQTSFWGVAVAKGQSTELAVLKHTETLNIESNNIPIGIPEFNDTSDFLMVIKNSTTLVESVNYQINSNGTSIDSLEGLWDGTETPVTFHFIVMKNMVVDLTFSDGTMIQDGTVPKSKLTSILQNEIDAKALVSEVGDIETLETLNKNNIVASINELNSNKANVNVREDETKSFVVEVRTTDPTTPAVGQMWLRSDL